MDLTIPIIASLGYLGYNISSKNSSNKEANSNKKNKLNDNVLGKEKPSSKHVYNSSFVKEAQLKEKELSTLNYLKSRQPAITNVINSSVYPLDCKKEGVYCNDSLDVWEEKDELLAGPLFNQALDYLNPKILVESADNVEISELSGLPMEKTHNNMMPYTTLKGDYRLNDEVGYNSSNNIYQSKLYQYTGNDKTTQPKNVELIQDIVPDRLPMKPTMTQLVDFDRYNTSKNISGVLPFSQITVGKIPQQLIQTPVKTVDELRSKNSPKITYQGRTNHAKINSLPMNDIGQDKYQIKSRSPREFELGINNSSVSRQYKAGNIQSKVVDFDLKPSKTFEETLGNVGRSLSSYLGISDAWNAITGFKKDDIGNGDAKNSIRNARMDMYSQTFNDSVQNSTYLKSQERDSTTINKYTGNVGKSNFAPSNRNIDPTQPKITNKEMNLHEYQGISRNPTNAPMSYKSFTENAKLAEKVYKNGYFAGGSKEQGTSLDIYGAQKFKTLPSTNNYFGNGKMEPLMQKNAFNYGFNRFSNNVSSTDFSDRYVFMKPETKKKAETKKTTNPYNIL